METESLIKEILVMLDIFGMNPYTQNRWSHTKAGLIILLSVHINTEILLQFFFNWKGWESVEGFPVCAALSQTTFKVMFMVLKKRRFLLLFNYFEQFWSWNNLEDFFRKKLEYISASALKFMKLLFVFCLMAIFAYVMKPLLENDKTLPFDSYNPRNRKSEYYTVMYILQIMDAILGATCVVLFDSLFVCFIIHIICEVKIIKHRFLAIKPTYNTYRDGNSKIIKISDLIRHHNLILKCITSMDRIYSSVLLFQFGSSLTLLCAISLTMVAVDFPPDLEHFMKYAFDMSSMLTQLLIYCIMGTFLIAETQSVSEAVYESEWWNHSQSKLTKAYVLIIQRTQKTEMLKAGRIFPLNLESFTMILRFGLSFITMAKAVYVKTTQK